MEPPSDSLSPPQRLAIAYALENVREAFQLLLEFDAKLRGIVVNANETLIGQLKLAWWRDAVTANPGDRPRGEPLLARLNALTEHDIRPELEILLTAWERLLLGEGDAGVVHQFAQERGRAIFGGYVRLLGAAIDVEEAGTQWAVFDVQRPDGSIEARLPTQRRIRPLSILALSVRDVSGSRMIWRALTGR
jgi:15-cis-phytoene synthase